MDDDRWSRAERLDARRLITRLEARTGTRLTFDGPCPGGEGGAAYVRWPDGHRAVLTGQPGRTLADLAGPLAAVELLRRRGYPAPRTELTAQVGDAVVVVQQLLPGNSPFVLTHGMLDDVLALNELQAGAAAGRPDLPVNDLHLDHDGPGFCLHGPLAEHSPRSAALLHRIESVGAESRRLDGDDVVHFDLQPSNLLCVGDRVTGVVDWDAAARGDRRLDLVTLRFGVPGRRLADGVAGRLDALLDTMPPEVLRPAWAHVALRLVDWAIRYWAADDVDGLIDLAEQRLG